MSLQDKRGKRKKQKGQIGGYTTKLSVPDGLIPADRVGRWCNDVDMNIKNKLDEDWEFVQAKGTPIGNGTKDTNSDIGTKVSAVVGSTKTGEPMRAFLMMKWKDWQEEDQVEKQKINDDIEAQIKNPGFGVNKKGVDKSNTYGKMQYKA